MGVTINPNTKQVLLTSIPRDCWVVLENMQEYDKLTHSGLEGAENSVATIENFFEMDGSKYHEIMFVHKIEFVEEEDKYIEYTLKNIDVREKFLSLNPWH